VTTTLVTGGAGFIGSNLAERLLARGEDVAILDCFDPYYDPAIKRRTAELLVGKGARLIEADLRDAEQAAAAMVGIDRVVHLAARPGVRASIQDPQTTFAHNVTGTLNVVEGMRQQEGLRQLIFASSSSVYGGDAVAPFKEESPASLPLSPYAASKRACEHLCASYVQLFGFQATGLRFFTVYGPRGRPDMSIGKFIGLALRGEQVPLYGDGSVVRDFTYVDDIVDGIVACLDAPPEGFEVLNIGGGCTATMSELIDLIGEALGSPLDVDRQPAAAGDMPKTHADLTRVAARLGFSSKVPLAEGIKRTVAWAKAQAE